MESIAGERTLDTFKTLYRASEYYKVNIVIFANGKTIPVESIVTSSDGIRLLYTFAFRGRKIKKICAHVFTQDIETNRLFGVKLALYIPAPRF